MKIMFFLSSFVFLSCNGLEVNYSSSSHLMSVKYESLTGDHTITISLKDFYNNPENSKEVERIRKDIFLRITKINKEKLLKKLRNAQSDIERGIKRINGGDKLDEISDDLYRIITNIADNTINIAFGIAQLRSKEEHEEDLSKKERYREEINKLKQEEKLEMDLNEKYIKTLSYQIRYYVYKHLKREILAHNFPSKSYNNSTQPTLNSVDQKAQEDITTTNFKDASKIKPDRLDKYKTLDMLTDLFAEHKTSSKADQSTQTVITTETLSKAKQTKAHKQ